MPTRFDLLWPVLKIVEAAGRSASVEEILAQLETEPYLRHLGIGSEALDVLHGDGPKQKLPTKPVGHDHSLSTSAHYKIHVEECGQLRNKEEKYPPKPIHAN